MQSTPTNIVKLTSMIIGTFNDDKNDDDFGLVISIFFFS